MPCSYPISYLIFSYCTRLPLAVAKLANMKLLGVCVGKAKKAGNKQGATGIDKQPVTQEVTIGRLGLQGDEIVDTQNHGGLDQAVYIYTQPDYEFWRPQLGQRIRPGLFGENLLFSGLESATVCIGQRFLIGSVLLEATDARIPCATFSEHMGDLGFVKKFREARRPGIYARVLQSGTVRTGDSISLANQPLTDTPTILDAFEVFYNKQTPTTQLERLLAAPISSRRRNELLAAVLSHRLERE